MKRDTILQQAVRIASKEVRLPKCVRNGKVKNK